jgi:trans-2,3-dihydro-3-hydroxyanthranilate isomerase
MARRSGPELVPITFVNTCQRAGQGGQGGRPTAVLDDLEMDDEERRALPALLGTSHVVFVAAPASTPDGGEAVGLRFFTSAGELPACGHGTVAALTYLASRSTGRSFHTRLSAGERVFDGQAIRIGDGFLVSFDPGPVALRAATEEETAGVLDALGLTAAQLAGPPVVGSVGRERMLVPVWDTATLAALAPDLDRLRRACDPTELLGCYVWTVPAASGRGAARMFAPSVGIDEDIANANGTACLAAHLTGLGIDHISIDMGDAVGVPSTVVASTSPAPGGFLVSVGGHASIDRHPTVPGYQRSSST